MRIGVKLALLATLAFVAFLALLYTVLSTLFVRSFTQVEEATVKASATRAQALLESQAEELDRILSDWAVWDDTYAFLQLGDETFLAQNLTPLMFHDLDLDGVGFIDGTGRVLSFLAFDGTRLTDATPPSDLLAWFDLVPLRRARQGDTRPVHGFLRSAQGPLLAATRPVTRNDGSGAFLGSVVFLRFLTSARIDRLEPLLQVRLELFPDVRDQQPADLQEAASRMIRRGRPVVRPLGEERIAAYLPIEGLQGSAVFWLRVTTDRPIHREAQRARRYLVLSLLGIGLLFFAAIFPLAHQLLRAAARQRSAERLFHAFVEQTAEAVLLADGSTLEVLEMNRAARRLLDVPLHGKIHPRLDELISLPADATGSPLPDLCNGGELTLGDFRHLTPEGTHMALDLSVARILLDDRPLLSLLVRDVTARKAAEAEMHFLAYHDALTRLPNRLLFEDRLSIALAQARRDGRSLAILFIDLDHLKQVNDSQGHQAGDRLLQEVAYRISTLVRDGDTVARVGGAEFLALLPTLSSPDDPLIVCERLLEGVRRPVEIRGRTVVPTASIGCALFPKDGEELEELLRKADIAMYRAKEAGRNCWRAFQPEDLAEPPEMKPRLTPSPEGARSRSGGLTPQGEVS